MAGNKKELVWHKKKEKFLPVSIEKAKAVSSPGDMPSSTVTRRQQFANDLAKKIRIAVRNPSKDKSAS